MASAIVSAEFLVENVTRKIVMAERVGMAASTETRRQGLLASPGLEDSSGLWIAPCEAVHTFGMAFSIDVVFLDRDFRVCKLKQKVGPGRIALSWRAASALELAAGRIQSTGTSEGDQLTFRRRSPATA
jgi:uncharacterized membrane protein (UPF0127 family)